jgi:hypothetical protein
MAGVKTEPEPRCRATGFEQSSQLGEGAPERAASAGRVLQMQRAVVGVGERGPAFAEPGCTTTAVAPIPSPTRSEWVSEASDLARISGSSEAQLTR